MYSCLCFIKLTNRKTASGKKDKRTFYCNVILAVPTDKTIGGAINTIFFYVLCSLLES